MIINLTPNKATSEQLAQGVVDLPDDAFKQLQSLLVFHTLPTKQEMDERATAIAGLLAKVVVEDFTDEDELDMRIMIDGCPFFMPTLERTLKQYEFNVTYSFSLYGDEYCQLGDGAYAELCVYKHIGFIDI